MRLTIYELGSSLEKLLSILKINREKVPLGTLKTYYKAPYESLIRQINETASDFVKKIVTDRLPVSPDFSLAEQADVINRAIRESGMVKQMGRTLNRTYDVRLLHQMALELREKIEAALYPYIAMKSCTSAGLSDMDCNPDQEKNISNEEETIYEYTNQAAAGNSGVSVTSGY